MARLFYTLRTRKLGGLARRKRLRYVVPSGQTISISRTMPAFGRAVRFLSNTDNLTVSRAIPAFSRSVTFLGTPRLAVSRTIPAFTRSVTFAGEAAVNTARLPDNVMKGAHGGPTFSTPRLTGISGIQQRVINFEQSVNSYVLGYGLNKDTWPSVLALYYAQRGGAFGFLVKDWSDYQISGQAIGTGDGSNTSFQLVKTYATATRSYTRILTQPQAATLVVKVAGVATSAYTLLPNGVVSFNAPPANAAAITAACNFDILVAFADDHLEIQLQTLAAGQIPVINLQEIPPTVTGLSVVTVISAPSGNVDPTHLPENVERAAKGGPTFSTTKLISTSGKRQLNANYQQSVNSYTIGYSADEATWPQILALFYAQLGGAYGFTFRDWSDYAVSNQLIGIGDGSTQNFQLVRLYDSGPRRTGRYVTLPRAGTLSVTINGTPTVAYTLNPGGGVNFNSAPAAGAVIAASFEFDIPVYFVADHLEVTIQPGNSAPASVAQITSLNLQEILPGSP